MRVKRRAGQIMCKDLERILGKISDHPRSEIIFFRENQYKWYEDKNDYGIEYVLWYGTNDALEGTIDEG